MKTIVYFVLILLVSVTFPGCQRTGQTNPNEKIRICYAKDAGFQEQLAAKELRRYLYLCTGKLYEIQAVSSVPNNDDLIVVAAKGSELLKDFTFDTEALKSQEYAIKTIDLLLRAV